MEDRVEGLGETISTGAIAWNALLATALGYMGYTARKRDEAIDKNAKDITDLALKSAESYATKETMMDLYKETTRTNEMAIARVEKSIENTNATISKQGDKIDNVSQTINLFQTNVMAELAKKT